MVISSTKAVSLSVYQTTKQSCIQIYSIMNIYYIIRS